MYFCDIKAESLMSHNLSEIFHIITNVENCCAAYIFVETIIHFFFVKDSLVNKKPIRTGFSIFLIVFVAI